MPKSAPGGTCCSTTRRLVCARHRMKRGRMPQAALGQKSYCLPDVPAFFISAPPVPVRERWRIAVPVPKVLTGAGANALYSNSMFQMYSIVLTGEAFY